MNERDAILRDFVEWFDRRYPPGQSFTVPPMTLWELAERARKSLAVSNQVDESGERDE